MVFGRAGDQSLVMVTLSTVMMVVVVRKTLLTGLHQFSSLSIYQTQMQGRQERGG